MAVLPTVARPPKTAPISIIVFSPITAPILIIAPIMITALLPIDMISDNSTWFDTSINFLISSKGTALYLAAVSISISMIFLIQLLKPEQSSHSHQNNEAASFTKNFTFFKFDWLGYIQIDFHRRLFRCRLNVADDFLSFHVLHPFVH